jgi:acyl-CoA thioester hydrolase
MRAHQYVALFDEANTAFLCGAGLTDAELRRENTSPFLMDMHVCYLKEVRGGSDVALAVQVLGYDARRARVILMMQVLPGSVLAATCELAVLNMDLVTRRACPWTPDQMAIWRRLADEHADLPTPPQAGRAIVAISPLRDAPAPS